MTKKQRARTVLQELVVIIILGFIYLIGFFVSGRGIPCLFHKLTGLKCPGCGMTHAIAQLWAGQIRKAWEFNALCISVLPFICFYMFYRAVCYVNNDEGFHIWEYVFLVIMLERV